MRTNIIVPFKDTARAKERLADFLTATERRELAIALFRNTMKTLLAVTSDILVVTDSRENEQMALEFGANVLFETDPKGETEAVNRATLWSLEHRYDRQAVIPADMADLAVADLEALLTIGIPSPSVILVPAVGDDGTNAILTNPPDALPYRFGKASFPEYLLRAAEIGIAARVLRLPSFTLDIDTPSDLKTFMESNSTNDVYKLLRSWKATMAFS